MHAQILKQNMIENQSLFEQTILWQQTVGIILGREDNITGFHTDYVKYKKASIALVVQAFVTLGFGGYANIFYMNDIIVYDMLRETVIT